jgi:3-hydroxymyristoyl/3-hydroxydecanoyl-(acyl carrier protein) dehydratase
LKISFKYDQSFIEMILPHRQPFLMVDSIISYKSGKNPSLLANYTIKDKEPLCFTNEPDDHWPSMYVMEGLGQSCNLLIVISALEQGLMKANHRINSMDDVFRKLMDKETDVVTGVLKDILHQRQMETFSSIGFMGAANMEITGHARQGHVISYEVQFNQAFGSLFHSVVKAYTDGKLIAHGTMVSARRKD